MRSEKYFILFLVGVISLESMYLVWAWHHWDIHWYTQIPNWKPMSRSFFLFLAGCAVLFSVGPLWGKYYYEAKHSSKDSKVSASRKKYGGHCGTGMPSGS